MNLWLLISSLLSFILGIGHSLLGEFIGERVLVKTIHKLKLFDNTEKDLVAKRVVRLAWHATSIMWCGFGAIFLYVSFITMNSNIEVIIRIISITFLLTAVLALVTIPKRLIFLVIAVISWIGTL
jgi:hypothetical protein